MGATIKDIARELNISVSTVSYALNDGPRKVPDLVKKNVLRVAKELNYRPNRVARSLVTRRSRTLGILPTEAAMNLAQAPHFQLCFNGIINQAERFDHDVLVYSRFAPGASKDQNVVSTLSDGRADGIILIAPFVGSPFIASLLEHRIPIVIVNASYPGAVCMTCDNALGVRQAIGYLAEMGHTKIGHIAGWQQQQDGIERRVAFLEAMQENGLTPREQWIKNTDFLPTQGYEAALEILSQKDRPTALFCASDELAFGTYGACRKLGLRIPEDVSIVGYDDVPNAEFIPPGMTTISQPLERMAETAVDAVMKIIEGEPAESQTFETRLIVRGSSSKI